MRTVIISGYFNPIHTGHLDYIEEAARLGDQLVVIVNNDKQVKVKGSVPFMNERDRLRLVRALKEVDAAVLSIDTDSTVLKTLRREWERYSTDYFHEAVIFANGGDREAGNTPEEQFCNQVGIRTAYNVGGHKTQSSSTLIKGMGNER